MKRLGIVLLATVGFAAMAQAADLPSAKAPAPAAKPDCWSSAWAWFQNSAADCPLSYYGFTLYGTLDVNGLYNNTTAGYSPSATQPYYGIAKPAHASEWMFGYNGMSTSAIGVKMKEDILPYGWSLIGVVEAGVNPYSGMFPNGPRSLADNNVRPYVTFPWQTTNSDSSRAGQWDNAQAYIGVSNKTYGTLTFGRTNTLSLDVTGAYDPVASNAFSLIGYSSSFPGFGNTETVRNTAVTYRLTYQNFRAAAQIGVGGYDWDNGNTGIYQGQLGADFGPLSVDGVLSYAENAVSLSSYGLNPFPAAANLKEIGGQWFIPQKDINGVSHYYDPNDVLKATISNNFGAELTAKYKWNTVTFYGGYMYARLSDPSNSEANGFSTIAGGIFVPSGAVSSTAYLNNGAVNAPSYAFNRVLNTVWTGFKWAVLPNLDVAMGFYYQSQNNYNFAWNTGKINGIPYGYATSAACTGTGAFINSGKCAGSQDAVSLLVDYRPVKRMDLYAGVMVSNVYGGLASGYYSTYYAIPGNFKSPSWSVAHTQSWDPTIGIRFRF